VISEATTPVRGQAGGLALVQKYGREYFSVIGRLGGRSRALTSDDINRNIAPAAQIRERRHGKGLKELLRLWEEKQACSSIIAQGQACCQLGETAGRETRTGVGTTPGLLPVPCGPGCNRGSRQPLPFKGDH